jgi:tRNA (guanine37-N1)-methyltransferase
MEGLLDYPQYTRPLEFRGWKVPEILLSGDHREIQRWREQEALKRTQERRPDLLDKKDHGSRSIKEKKEI